MEVTMKSDAGPQWSLVARVGFRFWFIYLALYLPSVYMNAVPGIEWIAEQYAELWNTPVVWVGSHVLHLSEPITVRPNGSGDTLWNYVQLLCIASIAVVGTVIWSAVDFRRSSYPRLSALLRVAVRYGVAVTMLTYGAVKIVPSQFPAPGMDRLIQPIGSASPMGLLWTFMGFSPAYSFFAGFGEVLGGLLLTTRRTTLLGAIISFGVMAHVAALNLCFDVPVKLLSLHLVALNLYLILPDAKRLLDFFVLNRTSQPRPIHAITRWRWLNVGLVSVRTFLVIGFLSWQLHDAEKSREMFSSRTQASPYFGVWAVTEFVTDGKDRPALLTDERRWRRVIFEYPKVLTVQFMNDSRHYMGMELDEPAHTLKLKLGRDPDKQYVMSIEQPQPDELILDGKITDKQIHAKLVRDTKLNFPLMTRGFHWINDFPRNQ